MTTSPFRNQYHYNKFPPPSIASIESALNFIPPDLPRDDWARAGMALHNELGEAGFPLFDSWSQGGSTYSHGDTRSTWQSIRSIHGVTISTLFWMAKQYGHRGNGEPITSAELNARESQRCIERKQQRQQEEQKRKWAGKFADDLVGGSWAMNACSDTPAHLYLQNRLHGHPLPPLSSDLRYHPSLEYRHTDGSAEPFSALLGVVRNHHGNVCSIHRTYITEDGRKAPVESPKKLTPTTGYTVTGAGIYCGQPAKKVVIAEGVESALALSVALGTPAVAAVSAHGLANFQPQKRINQIWIGADNDLSRTGQRAAQKLADRTGAQGISYKIITPPVAGIDFSDMLRGDAL